MTSPDGRGSRILVLALCLVVLGLCLWLIVFRSGQPPNTVSPPTPVSVVNPSVAPENKGARPPTTEEQRVPVTVSDKAATASLAGAADPFAGMTDSASIRFDLTGRVFGGNDEGLEGAAVQIFDFAGLAQNEAVLEAKTDAGGFYAFHDVTSSIVMMQVNAEGYIGETAMLHIVPFLKADGDYWKGKPFRLDFHLTAGGLSLHGRVVARNSGDPIQGARIEFVIIKKVSSINQTTTDEEGRFRLTGLSPEAGALTAMAKGYTSASKPGVRPGPKEVKIALGAGGHRICGRVIGARSRKPLPGATVAILSGLDIPLFAAVITADGAGRFVTPDLAPGEYVLGASSAQCEGYNSQRNKIDITATSPEETEVELVAVEPITVRGWVKEKDTGKGIGGAVVRGGANPVVTDEEGRFQLQFCSNPAGKQELKATAKGYLEGRATLDVIDATHAPSPVTIALTRSYLFSGAVRDAAGSPVEGARVRAQCGNEIRLLAMTGSDGRFEAGAPPKVAGMRISVVVATSDKGSASDRFVWPADQPTVDRTFTLSGGKDLNVVILDKDDKGVAGLTVRLYGHLAADSPMYMVDARTDSEGAADFRNLPTIKYSIYVYRNEEQLLGRRNAVDMAAVESPYTLTLHLEGERTVTGHVTDPEGKPLEGVQILEGGSSTFRTATTDAEGVYRLSLPEDWQPWNSGLVFFLKGYEVARATPNFNGTPSVVVDQVLTPLGRIFGRVVGPDGKPLETTVELAVFQKEGPAAADSMAYSVGSPMTTTLTEDGGFEIHPRKFVSGDSYSVRATEPAFGSGQSTWVRADESRQIGPLEIRLSWRGLKGRVLDAESGQPVAGAIVTLHLLSNGMYPEDWQSAAKRFKEPTAFSDSQGQYELEPVPAGEGTVYVRQPDYGIQRFPYTIDTKGNGSGVLDLSMALRVDWRGRLLYRDGTPVTNWVLNATQTVDPALGTMGLAVRSKNSGGAPESFEMAPLAPGPVKFELTLQSSDNPGICPYYEWNDEIPKVRERRDDLVLPALVPVQITFLTREAQGYEAFSSNMVFSRIRFSFILHGSSPTAMTGTVLLPPGHITFRVPSNPTGAASSGATPKPAPRDIEVDIPVSGPYQIQLT